MILKAAVLDCYLCVMSQSTEKDEAGRSIKLAVAGAVLKQVSNAVLIDFQRQICCLTAAFEFGSMPRYFDINHEVGFMGGSDHAC